LPDAFPDIDILLSYVNPLTSESAGRASDNLKLTWAKEPDLGKLAATCEFYFEWGYRDAIIKRFKTVIWHGAVLRILRRGVLDMEEKRGRREIVPSTPTKNGKPGAEGTPSKLITKHFSSLTLNPVANDDDDRLITRITRTREHAYTDGILEYRLEIRPRQLVLLAESGIKNIRRPLDADVWAGLTESGNEGGEEKAEELTEEERRAREEKEVLVWMPASMVRMAEPRLVEEFEKLEEAKRLKKAGKGTKRSPAKRKPKAKAPIASDEELSDAPKAKAPKKAVRKAKPAVVLEEDEESEPVPPKKAKAKPKPFPALDSDISSDDELPIFQLKAKAPAKRKQTTGVSSVPSAKTVDPFASMEPSARVVRDLTKGKGKAVADGSQADLKNFFPLSKAIARAKTNVQPLSAPLAPVPKLVVLAADSVRERTKHSTLSAPTPGRQTLNGSPSRAYLKYCQEKEESDDDVRRPATPSKIHGKKSGVENARTPSRMLPRPFPLSFEDRPPPRRRSSITSSDCDSESRSSRLSKSPRKSVQHTSPREKLSAVRAPSPTPYRGPNSPSARNLPVIDISSDSDSPRPPRCLGLKTVANTVSKVVLRPTNFLSREVIDISDL
jgi:Holliday junction resolvase YEN1